MITSEKIDIACNYTKLQYGVMDAFIATGKLGPIDIKDKLIIMYDMSYTLSLLERISDITDGVGFNDANDMDLELKMRLVYGILNSVAHYRHYVTSKMQKSSVIILYSSDSSYYIKYSDSFSLINRILNMFRKTIFIERLEDETKFIYQHIAYFSAMNVSSLNLSNNKRCRIMYIGNNPLAYQLLRIDRDMINIKHGYIDCGTDIAFKSDIINIDEDIIGRRNIDLITSMLAIFGFKHGYPRLDSIKRKKHVNIYDIIYGNCIGGIDKDNSQSIICSIEMSESDKQLFDLRLRTLDVDFQNKLFSLSKTLLKIWSSKIDTKAMHSLNDYMKFDDLNLNINWLYGGN